MRSFPYPVRVATGLATMVVEQTQQLPRFVVGLPVTVTSQALQVYMRMQQQITELAIKGDQTLSGWQQAEDQPQWATFDEDRSAAIPEQAAAGSAADTQGAAVSTPEADEILPNYDELSIAQLRARLRRLTEADLVVLLDYERGHGGREQFVRMLSNRLETVRAQ